MSDLSAYRSDRVGQWSAQVWDGLIEAIMARLAPLEEQLGIQRAVTEAIVARGLAVIEAQLAPLVAQGGDVYAELVDIRTDALAAYAIIQGLVAEGIPIAEILGLEAALAAKAPLASPALTGVPTAPTAALGTNTTQIATMAAVKAAVDALKGSASAAWDTLQEIEAYITADQAAGAAVTTALGKRLRVDAAQSFTSAEQDRGRTNLAVEPPDNLLDNGDFDFWERNTIFSVAAGAAVAVADCWYVYNTTNQPLTVSRLSFRDYGLETTGSPKFWLRVTFANAPTTGAVTLIQRLEFLGALAGRAATFTAMIGTPTADAAPILATYEQYYGSGGSAVTSVSAPAQALVPGGTFYRLSFLLPASAALAGKTVGAGAYGQGYLTLTPRAAGNYDFAHVALVPGDWRLHPDPVKRRVDDQARVQRYFEKSYNANHVPGAAVSEGSERGVASSSVWQQGVRYKTTKRNAATVTIYSTATGAAGKVRNLTLGQDETATVANIGHRGFSVVNSVAEAGHVYAWHWTAEDPV